MKRRVILFLYYFLFWFLFFIACRFIFIMFHFHLTKELSVSDILKIFLYGSRMDLSMTGYLTVIPALIFLFTGFFKGKITSSILNLYTIIVLFVSSFLVVVDMELYRFWGFRLDTTPLMYLKTPKEAAGSLSIFRILFLSAFLILLYWMSLKVYFRLISRKIKVLEPSGLFGSLVFLPIGALLFLPIRGSLGIAPMNVGFVYFSDKSVYANHSAINVVWNVAYALTKEDEFKPYQYFERKEAEKIMAASYEDQGQTKYLLNTSRPNVLLIILESFTSKIIEPLGGMKGITPNLNRLVHEGILFKNCYANGDRTDKGILSILNGYPGLPKNSIINFPKKTEKLPYINKDLAKAGYYTEFIYGCDIDFANFRSYFANAGYDKLITRDDFPASQVNSKWGAHDHVVLNKLFEECKSVPSKPFFVVFDSQSSHEPFEVPMKTVIHGSDEEHRFLNSAYYTDSCVGDFIRRAEKTDWWKNTLVIIVADHGIRHPGNTIYNYPEKFQIPVLWLGGALIKRDTSISTYFSQSDIPLTLLHQLHLENKNYRFSQDVLSSGAPSFAYYVFNEGVAFINKDGEVLYDHTSGKPVIKKGIKTDSLLMKAKAQLQVISTDFSER